MSGAGRNGMQADGELSRKLTEWNAVGTRGGIMERWWHMLQRITYEDYKYCMQDTGRLYVGSKYTLGEILDAEDILFKFRMIVERYILQEADREDTLETHLYYLEKGKFLVQTYKHMKARVKVNVIEEKKSLLGNRKKEYVTKNLTIEELVEMTPEEKERKGLVIQELSVSKLALAGM